MSERSDGRKPVRNAGSYRQGMLSCVVGSSLARGNHCGAGNHDDHGSKEADAGKCDGGVESQDALKESRSEDEGAARSRLESPQAWLLSN